jgi:hypothetical protein
MKRYRHFLFSACVLVFHIAHHRNYSGTSTSRTSRETKNIRVIENSSYRNTFFLFIFQLNLHQANVL